MNGARMVHISAGPTYLRAGVSEPRAIENHQAQPRPTTLDAFDKTFNTSLSTNPSVSPAIPTKWVVLPSRTSRYARARSTRKPTEQRVDRTRQAQKFIAGYAAFLKRQGKLPMYVFSSLSPERVPSQVEISMLIRFTVQVRVNPAGEGKSLNPVAGG